MAFEPVTISDDQLQALDDEHDGVLVARGHEESPFLFVLRRPTKLHLKTYHSLVRAKDPDVVSANEGLLGAMCVYPDKADQKRQLDRWPACAGAILGSDAFERFTGGALAAHRK